MNKATTHITLGQLQRKNTRYEEIFTGFAPVTKRIVDKVNRIINKLETSRDNEKPVPGDRIICISENGKTEYPNGHLEDMNYLDEFGCHICVQPYIPHCGLSDGDYFFSTSGGYWFQETDISKFEYVGKATKEFWTWGNTPCGNGGIYFPATVNVWKLKNKSIY